MFSFITYNIQTQQQSQNKLFLCASEKSFLPCLIYLSITVGATVTILFLTQKSKNESPLPRWPPLYCAEDNTCMLSLTPCISNYSAAPSGSVLTMPTCYTAECLASKWDGQEISHWSHLDTLMDPTGGNDHPSTVGCRNIMCFSYFTYISFL